MANGRMIVLPELLLIQKKQFHGIPLSKYTGTGRLYN